MLLSRGPWATNTDESSPNPSFRAERGICFVRLSRLAPQKQIPRRYRSSECHGRAFPSVCPEKPPPPSRQVGTPSPPRGDRRVFIGFWAPQRGLSACSRSSEAINVFLSRASTFVSMGPPPSYHPTKSLVVPKESSGRQVQKWHLLFPLALFGANL